VDGKTVRGAGRSDGTQVHLLATMTATGLVTAQREVDGRTIEITALSAYPPSPTSRPAPLTTFGIT
jgi:hypothetical protein